MGRNRSKNEIKKRLKRKQNRLNQLWERLEDVSSKYYQFFHNLGKTVHMETGGRRVFSKLSPLYSLVNHTLNKELHNYVWILISNLT